MSGVRGGLHGSKYGQMADFSPPEILRVAEISAAIFRDVDFLGSKIEKIQFSPTLRRHIIVANNYFSKRLKSDGDLLEVPMGWEKKLARNF